VTGRDAKKKQEDVFADVQDTIAEWIGSIV
jgi:hypothetical protein